MGDDKAHVAPLPNARTAIGADCVELTGLDEPLITLTEAAGRLPRIDGKKIAVATLWRWCRKGLRGAHLDYVRIGRRICTTPEAMRRFFSQLAELDNRAEVRPCARPSPSKRKPPTSRQREHALDQADHILARARI